MGRFARRRIVRVMVSLGAALLPRAAGAQDGPEQRLTGGSSRAWVAQRFARPAAPGGACSAGEIYTFAATHELTVSRCRDGRVVQSRHRWSILGADGDDPTLAIDGVEAFSLRFGQPGAGGYRMRLRAMGTQPDTDTELVLDED